MDEGQAEGERGVRVGRSAVLTHVCVTVAIPLVGFGNTETTRGLALFFVMPTLATAPLVYLGASRMAAPQLAFSARNIEDDGTNNDASVVVQERPENVLIARRRNAAKVLALGLGLWAAAVGYALWAAISRTG